MYTVFLDELSGRTFVGDFEVINSKVEALNKKTEKIGRLYENEYFKTFDLMEFPASIVYLPDQDVLPLINCRWGLMNGVPIVRLYLDTYKCLVEPRKEE